MNSKDIFLLVISLFSIILTPFGIIFAYDSYYKKELPNPQEKLEQYQSELEELQSQLQTTKEETEANKEEEQPKLKSLGKFKITAYCSCSKCCGKSDGITASGTKATAGRTIAAPSNFKFGTKLIINGHEYTVEDRGGAIKGNRIDIYFDSHQEALDFGVQYIEVFIENK